MVSSGQADVGSSPVLVCSVARGATVVLKNTSTANVFIGPPGVTTATGHELATNEAVTIPGHPAVTYPVSPGPPPADWLAFEVWGVTTAGSAVVTWLST
jgi:hypothetical protein